MHSLLSRRCDKRSNNLRLVSTVGKYERNTRASTLKHASILRHVSGCLRAALVAMSIQAVPSWVVPGPELTPVYSLAPNMLRRRLCSSRGDDFVLGFCRRCHATSSFLVGLWLTLLHSKSEVRECSPGPIEPGPLSGTICSFPLCLDGTPEQGAPSVSRQSYHAGYPSAVLCHEPMAISVNNRRTHLGWPKLPCVERRLLCDCCTVLLVSKI